MVGHMVWPAAIFTSLCQAHSMKSGESHSFIIVRKGASVYQYGCPISADGREIFEFSDLADCRGNDKQTRPAQAGLFFLRTKCANFSKKMTRSQALFCNQM